MTKFLAIKGQYKLRPYSQGGYGRPVETFGPIPEII